MTTAWSLCLVVLDHRCDEFFEDIVTSARWYCPDAFVCWYDSGQVAGTTTRHDRLRVPALPCSRPLEYAKVTTFFLDVLEWSAETGFDAVVNVESDMAFLRPGFETFVSDALTRSDYVAPRFQRRVSPRSRWRPARSLRGERDELMELIGVDYLNGGFSPGQVFGRRFVTKLLAAPFYNRLRDFVERNRQPGRSFSLQEVLFPTLVDALGLRVGRYPEEADRVNRYRPYHSVGSLRSARKHDGVHFVHPVRRNPSHPARAFVRDRLATQE